MSARATLRRFWRRGQRGWPASFPVAQLPNPPLLVALAAWLLAQSTEGAGHVQARGTFLAALAAWGWGEAAGGANWFRRGIGVGGFVYVIASVASALAEGD